MSHIDITFAIYPLPPTANTLDSAQRMRLMKSTDKIARILGTTPHVLEELGKPHVPAKSKGIQAGVKAIRRQGGLYSGYSSSSTSIDSDSGSANTALVSLPSSSKLDERPPPPVPTFPENSRKGRKGKKVPPPLFIRLNTIPVSRTDARFVASSPSPPTPRRARTCTYPTTPSSSTPRTPSFSATSTTPRNRSTRRSPSSKRTPSTPKTAKAAKSTPVPRPRTCSTSSKPVRDVPLTPCTPVFSSAEIKRKRIAKLARHLGEHIPAYLVMCPVRKSSLVGSPCTHELGASAAPPGAGMRAASWVGEWNRSDMQEVQQQLRGLKL